MKKLALLIFCAGISLVSLNQTYVYDSERMYYDQIRFTIIDGFVIPGNSTFWSDAVLTAHGNGIFNGFSTSTFDLLYSLDDGKFYIGESQFSFDIKYTISNGRVYNGDSTLLLDALFTYHNGIIYKGDSTFFTDAVLWTQGEHLNEEEIFAVLLASGLL